MHDDNLVFQQSEKMDVPISIADPDQPDCPLVFVNSAFEELTGYAASRVVGKNCRFLQVQSTDEAEVDRLRKGVRGFEPADATLLNSKANNETFHNLVVLRPLQLRNGRRFVLGSQFEFNFGMKYEHLSQQCFQRYDAMRQFSALEENTQWQAKDALKMRADAAVAKIKNYILRETFLKPA